MVAEKLFAEVPDIVFCIKNQAGQYISANPAFAERLGLSSTKLILGKTASDLFPAHLAQIYHAQDVSVMESKREITDRLELIPSRKGTPGWYLASKIPLFGKNKQVIGIASISRDLLTPGEEDQRFAGLVKVVDHIQSHFSEPMKSAELAALAGFSQTQLERRMKRVFKLSTSQFIRKTRIGAAAHMLLNESKAIVDIAHDCGYADQSAFARQFKSTVGMTPGVYRSSAR